MLRNTLTFNRKPLEIQIPDIFLVMSLHTFSHHINLVARKCYCDSFGWFPVLLSKPSMQCAEASKKANSTVGMIRRTVVTSGNDAILSVCQSRVRRQLE